MADAAPSAAVPAAPPAAAEPAAPKETLLEQWKRVEEKTDAPAEAEAVEGEKAAEEKPKAKKVKAVEPEPAPGGELEAMRQQATRLGFVVEDGKVTTAERAAFRAAKREAAEQRAAMERELVSKVDGRLSEAKPKLDRAEAIQAAIETADHDKLASALGFETWDKLIEDQIARKADPNYVRLRKLEEERDERAKRDEAAAKDAEQRQQAQAEQQARGAYMQGLSASMKASKDPLVAAFHDEPGFVQAIFAIQSANYDGGPPIPPEQAQRMKVQGATMTPREWIEALHRRAKGALEPAPAPAPEAAANGGAKPAPRTPSLPKPKAAASGKFDTDRAWKQDATRRLRDSLIEEEKESLKRA